MKNLKFHKAGIFISLLLILILASCSSSDIENCSQPEMTQTFIYYTQAARETQAAFSTLEAQVTESAKLLQETAAAIEATPAAAPDESMLENTQAASAVVSQSSQVCNWASFLEDISYPDGSTVSPGEEFTKTWRFKNIGSCAWDNSYSIQFAGGETFNANSVHSIDRIVNFGDTIDISLTLTAPQIPGTYMSYWIFSDGDGELFGIGNEANGVFWIKIEVK